MFLSLQQKKLYNDFVVVFSLVDHLIRALVDFIFNKCTDQNDLMNYEEDY